MFVSAEDRGGAVSSALFKGLLSEAGAAVFMAEAVVAIVRSRVAMDGKKSRQRNPVRYIARI